MNEATQNPPATSKRPWLFRFGMRTVFILIALAAVAAWWVRNELVKEQLREELVAEFSQNGNFLSFDQAAVPTWNQKLGAWLRGKPVVQEVASANVSNPGTRFPEFAATFRKSTFIVNLVADNATPEVLDAIAELPSFQGGTLYGLNELDDKTLTRLSKIRPKYEHFEFIVGVAKVDDQMLRSAERVGLRVTQLVDEYHEEGWKHVTDEGLQSAAKLPLTEVFAGRSAGDKGFAAFRDHVSAAWVTLVGPQYTDASAEVLATLPKLRDLSLYKTSFSDAALARVIVDHPMERFKVQDMPLGPLTIAALEKEGTQLHLKNVPLSRDLAAALAKAPIDGLTLEGPYDDEALAELAPLAPSLTLLELRVPQATDAGLFWLKDATKASLLDVNDSQISAAVLAQLPPFPAAWRRLSLGGPNIDAAAVKAVAGIPGINVLILYGPTIDDEALAGVQLPFQALSLRGTRVTARGLKSLRAGQGPLQVSILYAKGTEPPVSEAEAAEIESTSGGRITIKFYAEELAVMKEMLPQAFREASKEADSP